MEELGLTPRITLKDLALILVVFLVTHAFFMLISMGVDTSAQAEKLFDELGLNHGFAYSLPLAVRSVILAPAISLALASPFFALPHFGGALLDRLSLAYILTGLAFGFVYIRTGSLTAAMVSHSLQSCFAFSNVLLYGRGETAVSPFLYLLVFGCPVWTYLSAKALWLLLPKEQPSA